MDIYGQNAFIITFIKEANMALSKEVQQILDRARQNSSLVQSVDLGMQALSKQVSDLQAQVSAIPVGGSISQEDKDALAEATSQLDLSIATLQKDIPANTSAGNTKQQSDSGANSQPADQPAVDAAKQSGATDGQAQQAANQGDGGASGAPADQSGGPQPLPGTGQ